MSRLAFAVLLLVAFRAHAAAWPDLSRPPEQGGGERDAALVVGIEQYESAPAIPGAQQNAQDWFVYLTRGRHLSPASVTLLRNREATREKLLKYAAEAAGRVGPGGTLWVVFIGHGAPAKDGKDGVLVGWDAQQDADSLYARSVSQKELFAALARGRQAHTVALLDACFSGRTASGELVPGMQPLVAVTKPAQALASLVVLTAGKADQFAGPLPGAARPAFSYLLLGALRGWADRDHDGRVTAHESLEYLREVFGAVVKDRTQTPELDGREEGLVLSSSAKETGPDLVDLALEQGAPPPAPAPVPAPATVAAPAPVPEGPSPLQGCEREPAKPNELFSIGCGDGAELRLMTSLKPPQQALEDALQKIAERVKGVGEVRRTARQLGAQLALVIEYVLPQPSVPSGIRMWQAAVPDGTGSQVIVCAHVNGRGDACPSRSDYVFTHTLQALTEELPEAKPPELKGKWTCRRTAPGALERSGTLTVLGDRDDPEKMLLAFNYPRTRQLFEFAEAATLHARRSGESTFKALATGGELTDTTAQGLSEASARRVSLELTGTRKLAHEAEGIVTALAWESRTFRREVRRSQDRALLYEDICTRH